MEMSVEQKMLALLVASGNVTEEKVKEAFDKNIKTEKEFKNILNEKNLDCDIVSRLF